MTRPRDSIDVNQLFVPWRLGVGAEHYEQRSLDREGSTHAPQHFLARCLRMHTAQVGVEVRELYVHIVITKYKVFCRWEQFSSDAKPEEVFEAAPMLRLGHV